VRLILTTIARPARRSRECTRTGWAHHELVDQAFHRLGIFAAPFQEKRTKQVEICGSGVEGLASRSMAKKMPPDPQAPSATAYEVSGGNLFHRQPRAAVGVGKGLERRTRQQFSQR